MKLMALVFALACAGCIPPGFSLEMPTQIPTAAPSPAPSYGARFHNDFADGPVLVYQYYTESPCIVWTPGGPKQPAPIVQSNTNVRLTESVNAPCDKPADLTAWIPFSLTMCGVHSTWSDGTMHYALWQRSDSKCVMSVATRGWVDFTFRVDRKWRGLFRRVAKFRNFASARF